MACTRHANYWGHRKVLRRLCGLEYGLQSWLGRRRDACTKALSAAYKYTGRDSELKAACVSTAPFDTAYDMAAGHGTYRLRRVPARRGFAGGAPDNKIPETAFRKQDTLCLLLWARDFIALLRAGNSSTARQRVQRHSFRKSHAR